MLLFLTTNMAAMTSRANQQPGSKKHPETFIPRGMEAIRTRFHVKEEIQEVTCRTGIIFGARRARASAKRTGARDTRNRRKALVSRGRRSLRVSNTNIASSKPR